MTKVLPHNFSDTLNDKEYEYLQRVFWRTGSKILYWMQSDLAFAVPSDQNFFSGFWFQYCSEALNVASLSRFRDRKEMLLHRKLVAKIRALATAEE